MAGLVAGLVVLVGVVVVLVVRGRRHNNTKPTTHDMAMMSPRYYYLALCRT